MRLDRTRPARSLARRRSSRLEQLETRQLLAIDSLGAGSLQDFLGSTAQDLEGVESPWTDSQQWAVRTEPGADPAALDALGGLVTRRAFDALPDVQFLWFADAASAAAAGPALAAMSGVLEAAPLEARQQNLRFTPNDPLFVNQWHLKNTGQGSGTPGADIGAETAWDSVKGAGVVIGIVDDGLQHTHPDLSANYLASASYDFNFNDSDPSPTSSTPHGTSVAGVAAGSGNNGVGVSGAAPEATLAGLRLIAAGTSDADEAEALAYLKDTIDIYSNSWGPFDDARRLEGPGPLTLAAMADAATNGRNGLGNIYTWAAGNGLESNDNVNYDGYANSRYVISVAAIDHNGVQSYYSEPGAPNFIAAYSNGNTLGITTTDLVGNAGYAFGNYTSSFGGTSSAAPLAAGVVALILDANPNLSARDVKHILAHTARITDAGDSDWSTNGAGFHINHKYGFGAIDAAAAVELAPTWVNVGPEVSYASGVIPVSAAIPDNNTTGISRTFTVPADIDIETVEIVFNATHTSRGHLDVKLTSPDGTVSTLAERHGDTGDHFNNWKFSTVRSWGESSAGVWTLTVSDRTAGTTGTWNSWQINVYGTEANQPPSLNAIGPQSVDEGALLSFLATANDGDLDDLTFSLGPGAPAGASIDPDSGAFSWTPADSSQAPVVVRVIVSDGSAQDFEDVAITVNNLPPTALAGGPYTVIESHSLTLNGGGSDPAGLLDPLTFSWDLNGDDVFGDAAGATPTVSWSQLEALGISAPNVYSVKVRTNDGDGGVTTSSATTLTVEALPPQLAGVVIGGAHADYTVPTGSGEQLRTIPVGAIDQISLAFSQDVAISGDITVSGVNVPSYAIGSFSYDSGSHVATWTLAAPISGPDQIKITLAEGLVLGGGMALDGSFENPTSLSDPSSGSFPSGDDLPGGDFDFYITVLPGDANRDNVITGGDFTIWADNFGATGAAFEQGDFNGDGQVSGADFTVWSDNWSIDYTQAPSFVAPEGDRTPLLAPARVRETVAAAPAASNASLTSAVSPRVRRAAVDRALTEESFRLADRIARQLD